MKNGAVARRNGQRDSKRDFCVSNSDDDYQSKNRLSFQATSAL
jgi:hypothetical protein